MKKRTPLFSRQVADAINQLTLNTTDDGTLALIVMTSDAAAFDAVVDAFEVGAGVPSTAANQYPIAADEVRPPRGPEDTSTRARARAGTLT